MSSLREIKDHIGSVRSTLKITSAMKLVASSKLRKAQNAIEALRPYEEALNAALSAVGRKPQTSPRDGAVANRIAVIAISSNSSLCGGFNSNIIKLALSVVKEIPSEASVEVFPLGRKMAEAMKKAGYTGAADYSSIVAHPAYSDVDAIAQTLLRRYLDGELSRVDLVYTHFISTSRQETVVERLLPFDEGAAVWQEATSEESEYLVEPSADELAQTLLPQVISLKLYAAVLDSAAAEHSARTIAMQTATDNGNDLLSELTLEYNKGRQQKITSEILDIVGGKVEQ